MQLWRKFSGPDIADTVEEEEEEDEDLSIHSWDDKEEQAVREKMLLCNSLLYLSVCPFVCPSVCLSLCLFVCLSLSLLLQMSMADYFLFMSQ